MPVSPLSGKLLDAARLATRRGNLWEGAVRSGKTVSSILVWLDYVRHGPPGNLLMVGKTERSLKRNVIDLIVEMVGPKRCQYKIGAGEIELFGRTVYVAGANNSLAVEKIKGLTLAGGYGDEVTTWPGEFFSMFLTRLSVPGARWFGTTNPAGPHHWLMRDHLVRASLHLTRDGDVLHSEDPDRLDLARFSFKLTDNPHLTPDFIAATQAENVGLFYRRNILGEWVLAEGAVFDMWDPARHVVADLPAITRWIALGIDHGTVNPFAALLLGVGADRNLYLTREFRYDSRRERRQLSDVEYSQRLRQWLNDVPVPTTDLRGVRPEYTIVDPSAAAFRVQLHRDGLSTRLGDNTVLDGLRTLSSLLALGVLKAHNSCAGLLMEMPGYSWDDKAAHRGEDAPMKVDDHSIDGARYALHTTRSLWRPMLPAGLSLAA